MKQCEYCGCRNEDGATKCKECNEAWFTTMPTLNPEAGKQSRYFLFRFLISLLMGLAVFGLSLHAAWQNGRAQDGARKEQWLTQYQLRQLDTWLKNYRKEFNAYPTSLIQLLDATYNEAQSNYPAQFDGWNHEFVYSIDGTNALITSYGRDGKPGGDGLDCDLTNLNPEPKASLPTFHQFVFEMRLQEVIYSCQVSGVMAFLLCFFTIKKPDFTLSGILRQTTYLVVLLIGASLLAGILSLFHLPISGNGGH